MIRDLNLNDLANMENKSTFPMPNLNSPLYFYKKALDLNDELSAVFWLKVTSELSLIVNNEFSSLRRAYIMKLLDKFIPGELKKAGLDDIHLFVQDNHFANLLIRHFQFEDVPGRALYRRI